jgi:hypothetical protein
VGIEQRQRAFGMLPREILLPRREIGVREIAVGVGRVRKGEQDELEDLNRGLHIARPLIVGTDDARGDLGEKLYVGVRAACRVRSSVTRAAPPGVCSCARIGAAARVSAGACPGVRIKVIVKNAAPNRISLITG